jgi:predicted nucleic acid-binding protein
MIILDTNVLSEVMKPAPAPSVVAWLDAVDAQIAAIASVAGCAIATRDIAPFQAAGLTVINPWLVSHSPLSAVPRTAR